MIQDLYQLIALLDRHKHWTLRTRNRAGGREGYECTIWGDGKRVRAFGHTPLEAGDRALEKLRQTKGGTFRVVR